MTQARTADVDEASSLVLAILFLDPADVAPPGHVYIPTQAALAIGWTWNGMQEPDEAFIPPKPPYVPPTPDELRRAMLQRKRIKLASSDNVSDQVAALNLRLDLAGVPQ